MAEMGQVQEAGAAGAAVGHALSVCMMRGMLRVCFTTCFMNVCRKGGCPGSVPAFNTRLLPGQRWQQAAAPPQVERPASRPRGGTAAQSDKIK